MHLFSLTICAGLSVNQLVGKLSKEKRDSYLRNQVISSPSPKMSFSKKTRRYGQKNTPSSQSSSASSSPTATISLVHEPLHFLLPNISIEERIASYEKKYRSCMESRTELSSWIMKNKAKGLPAPLTEDYRPPTRSRFPDFLHGSLSTKPRRGQLKNNRYESIPTKSSLSTFLKKATHYSLRPSNSSSTAITTIHASSTTIKTTADHNNTSNNSSNISSRPKRNSYSNTPPTNTKPNPNRFSFTGSLNRFSLTKNSAADIEEKYLENNNADYGDRLLKSRSTSRSKKSFEIQSRKNGQLADKTNTSKRLSTSVALEAIGEDTDLPKRSRNRSSTPPSAANRTSSTVFGQQQHKKSRPQSTIIQSSQSVFLERLLSRSSYPDVLGARTNCQAIQPNISPKPNHMHQERLSPISSYSTTTATTNTADKEGQDMMGEWSHSGNNRHGFPWKLHSTSSTNTRRSDAPQPLELKKNRLSMIISPSLSIRLSPQKSHFLKRQSMMS
ncbi:hypothetical protein K501DRAFT_335338 [Backusella circina FSU 941]|nr:hypothetical protein K501DRAFT_335338 [Backusella circina FSU 941]